MTASTGLAEVALRSVQTADGGVRVEDYLTVLAAATGEAVLVAAGLFDIEHNELSPGSSVFGDRINQILTGDELTFDRMGDDTVVGWFCAELVPATVQVDDLPSPRRLYEHVASTVNSSTWGEVAVSVPDDNRPRVLPLRAAFEMRDVVDEAVTVAGAIGAPRWLPCLHATCIAMRQVQGAIEMRTAATLVLEVVFAMAKTVPVPRQQAT